MTNKEIAYAFFNKHLRMSEVWKSLKHEIYEAKHALKDEHFPTELPELFDDSLGDDDFIAEYNANIKDSVIHELAELVIKADDLSTCLGYDLPKYVSARLRYRVICDAKNAVAMANLAVPKTISKPKVSILVRR
jgi:hypothetical protein